MRLSFTFSIKRFTVSFSPSFVKCDKNKGENKIICTNAKIIILRDQYHRKRTINHHKRSLGLCSFVSKREKEFWREKKQVKFDEILRHKSFECRCHWIRVPFYIFRSRNNEQTKKKKKNCVFAKWRRMKIKNHYGYVCLIVWKQSQRE